MRYIFFSGAPIGGFFFLVGKALEVSIGFLLNIPGGLMCTLLVWAELGFSKITKSRAPSYISVIILELRPYVA